MASVSVPGNAPFWMVYIIDGTGAYTVDDFEDIEFECFTTEAAALARAEECVADYAAGSYRAVVFKVEPIGFQQKVEIVEFTPLGKGQTKPLVQSAVSAPKRRRMVLTDD